MCPWKFGLVENVVLQILQSCHKLSCIFQNGFECWLLLFDAIPHTLHIHCLSFFSVLNKFSNIIYLSPTNSPQWNEHYWHGYMITLWYNITEDMTSCVKNHFMSLYQYLLTIISSNSNIKQSVVFSSDSKLNGYYITGIHALVCLVQYIIWWRHTFENYS